MITFISGGVRSGKSSLAEEIAVRQYQQNHPSGLFYVATARPAIDEEMQKRIMLHQHSRGQIWTTIEESYAIDRAIHDVPKRSVVLVDCLTVWSSNVLFSERKNEQDMLAIMLRLFTLAKEKQLSLIFVSNDLNEALPVKDDWVQIYMRSLEAVHQFVVEHCDVAIQVIAGCPVYWKGCAS